jgi:uncharacterized tellurite resistance protein B-like protein
MLDRLLKSLRGEETPNEEERDDLPRAVAALLVEAAAADEDYTGDERALILSILEDRFSLGNSRTSALLAEAEAAQAEAHDLYQFSRVVRDGLSREEKMKLIEDMWRVVLTDDHRDPHEEMVIRRLVGLIHLEDTESTEARRRAEASPSR